MGCVDKLIGWIGRHKTLSALGIASLFGLGLYATNDYAKDKVYSGAKWAKDKLISKSSSKAVGASPAVVAPIANETAKPTETPQVSETPAPNYFDKEIGAGINIEGDTLFVKNVTNILETWKKVDPEVYREMVGNYSPKKIVRSNDSFSWYQLSNDVIEIPKNIEQLGGSDVLKTRKLGLPNLFGEYRNAMLYKTGKAFKTAGVPSDELDANQTGSIMNQVKAKYDYGIKLGLWTKEDADKDMEAYSKKIESGTFYDGAKLN